MQIPGGVPSAASKTGPIGARTASGCRLLLGMFLAFGASAHTAREYQVKAALVYNFARFVQWPGLAFPSDKAPVRICVIGNDPFDGALEEAIRAKTVSGRPLVTTGISDPNQAVGCQILFVSSSERKRLPAIFRALPPAGVLTIGDIQGFAAKGGIVNLKLESGRVRLEINVKAAERQNLQISSRVLTLAEIVKPGRRR